MGNRDFAGLLAALRIARGLSQERLAHVSGVSARAIGDLERGATRRPQRLTVDALANGLGLDNAERELLRKAARPSAADRPEPGTVDQDGALVGRERELAGLVELLERPTVRMVSVLGPAGVGKTALAHAALHRVRPDDATIVRLNSLVDGEDPAAAVRGLAPAAGRRLVLLDGFDHGRVGGEAVAALLARDAGLRLVVTARTPVRVRAEHRWPIDPLARPHAVRLLARRARDARPGFTLTDADTRVAGSVVRRLGGNPMAIELTAARLRTQTLSEVDAALAIEFAGAATEILQRVVRSAVDRLPRPEAERLRLLASLGRTTPHQLRRTMAAWRVSADHLDATIALLAAMALITVTGPEIRLTVPMCVREAVLGGPEHNSRGRRAVLIGGAERTLVWNSTSS
jgi:transcriptional regulator with XRE-family HTH domain